MINFVGPSYLLETRKADCQRTVNLYPKRVESGTGKAEYILEEVPGMTIFSGAIVDGGVRGIFTTPGEKTYAVIGPYVALIGPEYGGYSVIGSVSTSAGPVEMACNTDQVCIVDGQYGYTITIADDTVAQITDPAFYSSRTVAAIDGYMLFVRPDTGQFYISGFNDLSAFDALEIATAEGSPDNLTAVLADHRQARLFGTLTTEGWFNSGAADFPFSRDQSSYSQIGTISPHAARLAANSVVFIGQSEEGAGVVYAATGNTIQRISTHPVEEALQRSTDLTLARAFVLQDKGHLFYWLNAPGLETSWIYDFSSSAWHERGEVVNGEWQPHRAICHTFANGRHLIGCSDGSIYQFDRTIHAIVDASGTHPIVRERISPHNAGPNLENLFFGAFELDATSGDAADGTIPVVQMRYSNDGGRNWKDWRQRELGRTGETAKRIRWLGNGSGRDRVWHVRCSSNAPFSIIQAKCPVGVGDG